MSVWLLIALLGLLKICVASLMLWVPYRNDRRTIEAADGAQTGGEQGASDDDGGSAALPASPVNPRPRSPRPRPRRRGPHGSQSSSSPARVRLAGRASAQRVRLR